MKWRKFGFLGHYKKIKLEGTNLTELINRCMRKGVALRRIKWHNPLESTFEYMDDDEEKINAIAGHSYGRTLLKEGGIAPAIKTAKANIAVIIGAFLIGALIFYQGLFIAEIRISGYRGISETDIRQTLRETGIYEGARKPHSYGEAKKALFDTYDNITWISVYEKGRLIEVDIAEADRVYRDKKENKSPVNIVAVKSGMIERILPLQGNAKVERGDYVKEGDILISGRYDYQSTDYSRGDKMFKMYSHADGEVLARVPESRIYYMESKSRELRPTGKILPGIYFRLGHIEVDTTHGYKSFDVSQKSYHGLVNLVKPVPFELAYTTVRETHVYEKQRSMSKIREEAEAVVRQYEKQNLSGKEMVLKKSFSFTPRQNMVRVNVMMEVLEEIGADKPIKKSK